MIPVDRWKISAKWASRRHECNLAGIRARCGGTCCKSPSFWPPMASPHPEVLGCVHLGPAGCTLAPKDKPIVCHLYPLTLNKNDKLVVHNRATTEKGRCKGNHNNGPMIIDVLKDSLIELFGEAQYNRVRADIVSGKDSYFVLSKELLEQWEREKAWAEANVVPRPRSTVL